MMYPKCFLSALMLLLAWQEIHAQEPARPAWDRQATAKYLDERARAWLDWPSATRGQGTTCISCHTALHFALARPALGPAAEPEERLIASVKQRVANWSKIVAKPAAEQDDPFVPYYALHRKPSALGTEAVLNALVLVNFDTRRAKGVLSAAAKQALDQLWQQQQANGSWRWLEFGLNPWETEAEYYGAALAALAVGTAGKSYYEQADVVPKVATLKKYLTAEFPKQRLHHRLTAAWASSRLPGILTESDQRKLRDEVLGLQEHDGSWSLAKLGQRSQGKDAWTAKGVSRPGVDGDGYATGLVILALKRTGLPADHAQLKKGIAWLTAQQVEGNWPATYVNKNRDPQSNAGKFMRDAATALAVLALTEE